MKRISAALLAAALVLSFAACNRQQKTVAATTVMTTANATSAAVTATQTVTDTPNSTQAPSSESVSVTDVTPVVSTDSASTSAAVTTAVKATTVKATTVKATTAAVKAPSGKEEILSLFNDAVGKAVSSKAGYSKTRKTDIKSFSPDNIFKLPFGVGDTVKGVVYDFLGVGTVNSSCAKGKATSPAQLKGSTLKASDISSASCTLKDGSYEITLKLKDGSTSHTGEGATALERSPLCTGNGDKKEYDHKTAENIYQGITNGGASVSSVSESYSGAVIRATVNAKSGQLTKLTVSFDFSVELKNVKYIVKIGDCSGKASAQVTYSSFKY